MFDTQEEDCSSTFVITFRFETIIVALWKCLICPPVISSEKIDLHWRGEGIGKTGIDRFTSKRSTARN